MNARPTSSVIARASWLTRESLSWVRAACIVRLRRLRPGQLGAESTTQLGHISVQRVEIATRRGARRSTARRPGRGSAARAAGGRRARARRRPSCPSRPRQRATSSASGTVYSGSGLPSASASSDLDLIAQHAREHEVEPLAAVGGGDQRRAARRAGRAGRTCSHAPSIRGPRRTGSANEREQRAGTTASAPASAFIAVGVSSHACRSDSQKLSSAIERPSLPRVRIVDERLRIAVHRRRRRAAARCGARGRRATSQRSMLAASWTLPWNSLHPVDEDARVADRDEPAGAALAGDDDARRRRSRPRWSRPRRASSAAGWFVTTSPTSRASG